MENELPIFTAALNILEPWYIEQIEFRTKDGVSELHIQLNHPRGTKFEYEGDLCSIHDHQNRTWRHLDFFEHVCYLYAPVPRVKTPSGKVRLVAVPWASAGSSFTLLYEDKVMHLVEGGMSCSAAGREMRIDHKVVRRIINRQTAEALAHQNLKKVKDAGVDETSTRKGHNYLTIITDRKSKKVVGIAEGKDAQAMQEALNTMEIRGAEAKSIRRITMDMSKSYIAQAKVSLPKAEIIFDRFHIQQNLNKAMDKIRRREQKSNKALKKTRWLFLKSGKKLRQEERLRLAEIQAAFPNLGEAYRLKEAFKDILDEAYITNSVKGIIAWKKEASKSNIPELIDFVHMLDRHWCGIKSYFRLVVTNAYAERVNLKIQEIKRIAKGYRNINNFILMIYFCLGGLDFSRPTKYD